MLLGPKKSLDRILAESEKSPLKRQLGAFQLAMLGVGAIIGTGIFVLTAEAAQKAGPAMVFSFVLAGLVCALTALCYAEMAAMVPAAGSAYTYSYVALGERVAWMVGWALVLEYAVAASAVCVGWSKYLVGFLQHRLQWSAPAELTRGWFDGGIVNLPAVFIGLLLSAVLVRGTRESARVNVLLVVIKLAAIAVFLCLTLPAIRAANFEPFAPMGMSGVIGAAASIFFAYVGFDAIATAAEETRDPQRTIPKGLFGALALCTAIYLAVSVGVIGAYGVAPVRDAGGGVLAAGSRELALQCQLLAVQGETPLACSGEALAHVLRALGHGFAGDFLGLCVFLALPSVILAMLYGQTRIFFAMARDGLLPTVFTRVHPRHHTPHVVTWVTCAFVVIGAAFFPVGRLAEVSNAGTLFAFLSVSVAVMLLRHREPQRARLFRVPCLSLVGPLAVVGCGVLFFFLPVHARWVFPVWTSVGLLIYLLHGRRHRRIARTVR